MSMEDTAIQTEMWDKIYYVLEEYGVDDICTMNHPDLTKAEKELIIGELRSGLFLKKASWQKKVGKIIEKIESSLSGDQK